MSRRGKGTISQNYWPGFVDALAALLLVIVFLLVVFVLAQIFLTEALSGRDKALEELNSEIINLTDSLSLEKKNNEEIRLKVINLEESLDKTIMEKKNILDDLSKKEIIISTKENYIEEFKKEIKNQDDTIKENLIKFKNLEEKNYKLSFDLEKSKKKIFELNTSTNEISQALEETKVILTRLKGREKELESKLILENSRAIENKNKLEVAKNESNKNTKIINNLNAQIAALRAQLEALQNVLDKAEEQDKKQKVIISDLGNKLNKALAQKVQELSKYRSEFFGKLREVLGDRKDILIVGDRFVLQSEVLFSSGSAQLEDEGKVKLIDIAKTLLEIIPSIPSEINWILRVDGHTDSRPINNNNFASNWELSSARSSNVVKFLIKAGIPPKNLAATGFASFQPLDSGNDEISFRRNRRIEFKFTEK
ncbi:MAG: hypothetical protein CMM49_02550 [Rhodospirillaceae bacterium]|nr:hypothetical protein [Rhodospirillaceae bacterium]